VTSKQALIVLLPTLAVVPPVGTHGRDRPSRKHDTLYGEQVLGARLLARMARLIQPLDRALPLHPARRRAASRSYQHPDIHVRRAPASFESEALSLGMARGAVHPAGGRREEDVPAVAGACFSLWKEARIALIFSFVVCSPGVGGDTAMLVRVAGCSTSVDDGRQSGRVSP
jgi:hypothetical protein